MGTFQRPASRPYFLVTSSGEDCFEELLISSVFSLTALTLNTLTLDLRDWMEARLQNLELFLLLRKEVQEGDGSNKNVVIVGYLENLVSNILKACVVWLSRL